MNNDKFQNKYKEVFQDLKEEKMNWDFEDFLKKAEGKEEVSAVETPIIPIESKKTSLPKWLWMAASAVILFSLGFFLVNQNNNVDERAKLVENEIQKQKTDFINENSDHNAQVAVHVPDSVSGAVKDSVFIDHSLAEKDVLDDLLSKKSRIKKQSKPKFVYSSSKDLLVKKDSTGYEDSYVIVNGKRIDNVEEAINVTKYSFQVVANNVNLALTPKVMDNVDY